MFFAFSFFFPHCSLTDELLPKLQVEKCSRTLRFPRGQFIYYFLLCRDLTLLRVGPFFFSS